MGRAELRWVPSAAADPAVPAVLVGRAPRKALGSSSSSGINAGPPPPSRRGDRRPVGLNRVCVRPVPAWQRGISDFLNKFQGEIPRRGSKENRAPDGDTPGPSGLGAQPLTLDPAEDGECLEEE
ncbi:PAF15 factor, partial [Drymodes brunneopygia]|nr:PAF15 factor [Drymodes brunneopygia]